MRSCGDSPHLSCTGRCQVGFGTWPVHRRWGVRRVRLRVHGGLPGLQRAVPSAPLDERYEVVPGVVAAELLICGSRAIGEARQEYEGNGRRPEPGNSVQRARWAPTSWRRPDGAGGRGRGSSAGPRAPTDWPVDLLRAAKGSTTVSVVLPALDEASTVGAIVDAVRRDLMDVPHGHSSTSSSCSTPAPPTTTAAVARAAGARVVHRDDVLPERAVRAGQGRGAVALAGCDDRRHRRLRRRRPAGLPRPTSSPACSDRCSPTPRSHFVKAMYDRPLTDGAVVHPGGGGRVTELVARPLLNLHWPQLAGFVQPLAGEYAARRPLLERLPFATGYGVELALLIDALETVGPRRDGPGRPRRTTAPPPRRPAARPDGRRDLADGAGPAASRRRPAGRRADLDAVRARRVRTTCRSPTTSPRSSDPRS